MIMPHSAGVIGWPVAHSKSPLIHRFWLTKLGIDGDYGRFPVSPEQLGDAIRALPALGMRGINVTVPHKVAVMAHLAAIEPSARAIGAVNTVTTENGLRGHNTDVAGIVEALGGIDLRGLSTVIVGAGGAARAALAALTGRRHLKVTVVARDPQRAGDLLREFKMSGLGVPLDRLADVLPDADLVINASPIGMAGQADFRADALDALTRSSGVVFDMVYAPLETSLLAAARARGLPTIDGLTMLVGQAAAAFNLFFGVDAPRHHGVELRALLTEDAKRRSL